MAKVDLAGVVDMLDMLDNTDMADTVNMVDRHGEYAEDFWLLEVASRHFGMEKLDLVVDLVDKMDMVDKLNMADRIDIVDIIPPNGSLHSFNLSTTRQCGWLSGPRSRLDQMCLMVPVGSDCQQKATKLSSISIFTTWTKLAPIDSY
jgi:hypothetical protein